MNKIVILGAGGFAKEVYWLIREINQRVNHTEPLLQLQGFISQEVPGSLIRGLPVLGDDDWALHHLDREIRFVIAIADPSLRRRLAYKFEQAGFEPISLIHPDTNIDDDLLHGRGLIVCAGTRITCEVRLGDFLIINLNCTIGHGARLGDFCTLSPGVHISGEVEVESACEIGTGAVILPGKHVGKESRIGAGAVVVKSLSGHKTYIGIPATEKGAKI